MDLLILGASARAAAHSALRAGLAPAAIDRFGDLDLRSVAPCSRMPPGARPGHFVQLARQAPPGPWLYTGPLENHPRIVDAIARTRPLVGNPGPVLRAARDPFRLADALRAAGLPSPEVRRSGKGLPLDGSWLVKPLRAAGGWGVRPLTTGQELHGRARYYQRRIEGISASALFRGLRGRCVLLGCTLQLLGLPGAPFAYRGSLGPWRPGPATRCQLDAIGTVLVRDFHLQGIFGVDFICDTAGNAWSVEVNPRYTASVEVLELALRRAFLSPEDDPTGDPGTPPPGGFVAKVILFAERDGIVPPELARAVETIKAGWDIPPLGDCPNPGEHYLAGQPICSVFAGGATLDACAEAIRHASRRWRRTLDAASP